jgi:exodeoxyribonuclease-3
MRVITVNLNGIRAAIRKGFYDWVLQQNADVICVQELKAQRDVLADLTLPGYHAYFHFAEKKGYSGVGIYSRSKADSVMTGLGWQSADTEGRYVAIQLGEVWVASLYMPSGTSSEERQAVKFDFLENYENYLKKLSQDQYIICGDWNIAHKAIDLKNWRSNQKNSGFLPEERAWMDNLFTEFGYIDAFRSINPHPDEYTWWSHRGRAWEKNVGWRIDYQVISKNLKYKVKSAEIYKAKRFSDHAPLIIEYANML